MKVVLNRLVFFWIIFVCGKMAEAVGIDRNGIQENGYTHDVGNINTGEINKDSESNGRKLKPLFVDW